MRFQGLRTMVAVTLLLQILPVASFADDGQLRTVVVGLEGRRNVDEGLALALSDVLQGEVIKDKRRLVFGRTDLARVLAFESEKQALGCQDDSCLAELASAMDADRILTGSIDKVGSSYYVVIAEIDARKVEPVARVQKTLPLDEDALIVGVQEMTRELLRQSGARVPTKAGSTTPSTSATSTAPAVAAAADDDDPAVPGSIVIAAGGLTLPVKKAGVIVGETPFREDGVPPGAHEFSVILPDSVELPFTVDVNDGETASLAVELSVDGAPTAAELAAFETDDDFASNVIWGSLGSGVAICLGLGALGICTDIVLVSSGIGFYFVTSACVAWGLGLGLLVGGGGALVGWILSPSPPRNPDGLVHQVVEIDADGGKAILAQHELEAVDDDDDDANVDPGETDDSDAADDAKDDVVDDEADPAAGDQFRY